MSDQGEGQRNNEQWILSRILSCQGSWQSSWYISVSCGWTRFQWSRVPLKNGAQELISRHKLDAKLHCKTPFGAYCEVHTDPDITNTMEPRKKWGICLGPPGNIQGSYKFMSLSTGKKIVRRKFTEMLDILWMPNYSHVEPSLLITSCLFWHTF